jgi:TFIIF-interacting CTD phosphatase-like protein
MANRGKKTLVIDLDETLVHSSFNYISDSDFMVKVWMHYNSVGSGDEYQLYYICAY